MKIYISIILLVVLAMSIFAQTNDQKVCKLTKEDNKEFTLKCKDEFVVIAKEDWPEVWKEPIMKKNYWLKFECDKLFALSEEEVKKSISSFSYRKQPLQANPCHSGK